jgi:chemotaxis protein MotB
VTLLFALFVVLFASSRHSEASFRQMAEAIQHGFSVMSVNPPKGIATLPAPTHDAQMRVDPTVMPVAEPPAAELPELRKQLEDVLGASIIKEEIVVEQRPEGLVISLRELGFFDSGQAHLLPGAAEMIKRTAEVLMQHQMEVRVEGHSDDQPIHNASFQSNWELSAARATTVLLLMVNEGGFDPTHVSLSAFGQYRSLGPNDTPEARRRNRRVDIVVLPPRSIVPAMQLPVTQPAQSSALR